MSNNLVSVTEERRTKLKSVGSSYRLYTEANSTNPNVRVCELVDEATGQAWNKTTGQDWQEVFERAVDGATMFNQPKTAAEIVQDSVVLAQENARLREMVEALQAQQPAAQKRTKAQSQDQA